jgi:uncharacterized protein DUF6295
MCTGIVENTKVEGSGKGPSGWFPLGQASVSYDHPDHARSGQAIIIDFLNEIRSVESRISVELTPESAKNLVQAILVSLARGEGKEPGTASSAP